MGYRIAGRCVKLIGDAFNNGQKCNFRYGGRRHLGFCRIRILRVKAVQRPYSWCLYQIWCKSVQKWRSCGRLTDFKMAAAAMLDFCTMLILTVNLSARPYFQPMFQIQCKCAQKWPSYGQKCDFQYGGRRHLGFLHYVNFDGKSDCGTPFPTNV